MSFYTPPGAPPSMVQGATSGMYYMPAHGGGPTDVQLTQNRTFAIPIRLRSGTLTRIGIEVGTAQASTTIRLGIWDDNAGIPDALLLDAGTVDTSTTGTKEITISQAVSNDIYWLSATFQGGSTSPHLRGENKAAYVLIPYTAAINQSTPSAGVRDANNWTGALGANFGTHVNDVGDQTMRVFIKYA